MGPALAAVGAVVAALLQATIASRPPASDAQLQILLVFAVVLALSVGFDEAMSWAFVGGITVDLVAGRPLGSTTLTLVLVAGAAVASRRVLARNLVFGPVAACVLLSIVYSVVLYMVVSFVHGPAAAPQGRDLATCALSNGLLALLIALPFAWWQRRQQDRRRVVW